MEKNKLKIAIIVSKFNADITEKLYQGAVGQLQKEGVLEKNIAVYRVPGAFEIPSITNKIITSDTSLDAVITIGVVIKGETAHFEYICAETTRAIMDITIKSSIPVVYGVLTTYNAEQAYARSEGTKGNKGEEFATAAISMIELSKQGFFV